MTRVIALDNPRAFKPLKLPTRVQTALMFANIRSTQELMQFMAKHPGGLMMLKRLGVLGTAKILFELYKNNLIRVWEPDHRSIH